LTRTFAIIGNAAGPIIGFRRPLIEAIIVARGHAVFALAPDYDEASRAKVRAIGATPVDFALSRTGLNPLGDLKGLASLFAALRALKPHTVLAFGIKPAIYGPIAARLAGVPARFALITGLGYAFTDNGRVGLKRRLIGAAARLLYRLGLASVERVFMQNPDDADDFVALRIVPRKKVVTVNGTGVELDAWPAMPPVTTPVTFLLAARMLRDKGIVEFVDAARMVRGQRPDVRFVLVGDIDKNPESIGRGQLDDWVQSGVVEWPGHVDMRTWLAQASVFVLPSYREGVPRSTQEAMAMARPVITTDVPGCRETVIDGRNGFLVPVRDADALAAAMLKFIDQPELIATMGQESRKLAEEKFDARRVNAVMIEAMNLGFNAS
jgi:glycosyltransferase involved in cell wall biosynthesis